MPCSFLFVGLLVGVQRKKKAALLPIIGNGIIRHLINNFMENNINTELVKAADLQAGDKVVRDSDGEILTINKISKGMQVNSLMFDYKEGGWTSLPKNSLIQKLIK